MITKKPIIKLIKFMFDVVYTNHFANKIYLGKWEGCISSNDALL